MSSIGFLWQIMTSQLSLWKGGSVGVITSFLLCKMEVMIGYSECQLLGL